MKNDRIYRDKTKNYRINWVNVGKLVIPIVIAGGLITVGVSQLFTSDTKSLLGTNSFAEATATNVPYVSVVQKEETNLGETLIDNTIENALVEIEEPVAQNPAQTSTVAAVQEPERKYYVRATTGVNVRSNCDSSNNNSVLTTLHIGDVLELLNTNIVNGEWYEVSYNGQKAYINASYVDVFSREVEQLPTVVRATTGVRVRSVNNTASSDSIMGNLVRGEALEYIQTMPNGWYQVRYNGRTGYVSGEFSELDSEGLHYESVPVVTATRKLNVRQGPSTNADVVYQLRKGDTLQYTQRLNNGWVEVLLNGHPAYVSEDYVRFGTREMATNQVYGVLAVKNNTFLYSDRNCTEAIANVPEYSLGSFYSVGEDYCLVNTDYGQGYIRRADVDLLGNTAIVVDVTSQLQSLIINGEFVYSSPVVTGHSKKSPTPSGIWTIYGKDEQTTMAGHNVYYAMRLARDGKKTNYFLHDADEWRSEYGGEIYVNHGSNGCVNSSRKNAQRYYEATPVGTKVLIYRRTR